MKRILSLLSALAICAYIPVSCNPGTADIPQEKPEPQPEPQPQDEPESEFDWSWQDGYPVGVSVEEFIWNYTDGKKCLGFKATIDFKANPNLIFKCSKTGGAKKTPTQFFESYATNKKSKGVPFLAVNAGYFAGTTSVSPVISDGKALAKAWHSFNWPGDEDPQEVIYPVRAALGQMEDGHFETQWIYCTDIPFAYHTAYPDIAAIGNNEKTRTFRAEPPTDSEEDFPGCFRWSPEEAVGAGPMLVRNGVNVAEDCFWYECLSAGGTDALNYVNRTAAGITADGKLIIVVCDGRGSRGSAGVKLPYLADKFIKWGCTDAINFDGGGSSAMVGSDGKLLNQPSDKSGERPVVSAIILAETPHGQ